MRRAVARLATALLAGVGIWIAAFALLYMGQSLGCAATSGGRGLSWALAVLWLAHAVALAALARASWRRERRRRASAPPSAHGRRFLDQVAVHLDLMALGALLALGPAVIWLAPCL
ncbi:hypothetical protein [Bordetella sp. 2513F-2]